MFDLQTFFFLMDFMILITFLYFTVVLFSVVLSKPTIVNEMTNFPNFSFVDKINEQRRYHKATDMVNVEWDQLTADDTQRDVENILNVMMGCNAHLDHQSGVGGSWNCNDNDCGNDGDYLRLLINQPGFHHVSWNTTMNAPQEPHISAVEYLYSYLYAPSNECGQYYEFYNATSKSCGRNHVYKMYAKSDRVGCALFSCSDISIGYKAYHHFVCRFKALRTFRPNSSRHVTGDGSMDTRNRLYSPLYKRGDDYLCSECPKQFSLCHDGLCKASDVGQQFPGATLIFSILIHQLLFWC